MCIILAFGIKADKEGDLMDIKTILSETGADSSQICKYMEYKRDGNKKGQERILCRCKGIQNEKLRDKRKQLLCLDYMIAKVERGNGE